MSKSTNRLINESSPYLLQHAYNPVDWYPWGPEALQKAKDENKPMIISVGYAACHWCHVMEHESFEDESVAAIMNEHFVCIKVDREERPDIDQIYMNAVQLLSGRGGWPLNAFALPDGRPFYGGTYYPKYNWISLLRRIQDLYSTQLQKLKDQATALTQGIQESERVSIVEKTQAYNIYDIEQIVDSFMTSIDTKFGGFGGSPKFPMPVDYDFLLNALYYLEDEKISFALGLTLDKMAYGGIFDQIGGGFARYSVDSYWKVPHFEKMLYDNGQLISLYSRAYHYTKKPLYKHIVYLTIEFLERELMSDDFGFYSSLDADSEGEEGLFYIWTKSELESLLGDDYPFIEKIYHIEEKGNWENGHNILHQWEDDDTLAETLNLNIDELLALKGRVAKTLMAEREKRIRPGLDDKILLSWNAIALKGLLDAYRIFNEDRFLDLAQKNAAFIRSNLLKENGEVHRNFKNGKSTIIGFLDDHAFFIDACIEFYQATFDIQWLTLAKQQVDYVIEHFYDESSSMFFYTSSKAEKLIARKLELSDNVIPASNSQMAINIKRLAYFYDNSEYHQLAATMLNSMFESIKKQGRFFSNWAKLLLLHLKEPVEIAIVGPEAQSLRKQFDEYFIGHAIFLGGESENLPLLEQKVVENETFIYVCHQKTCQQPVKTVEEALKLI